MGFDNGTVTFRIDHTPLHRIAVQFEWAEPFGELQENQKIGQFLGHVSFRRKKNVCLSTQLGACSHPTGRPTVPYRCTIDVRTPWARHGVSTGPPRPDRDPTGPRRACGAAVACPRGPNINPAPIRDGRATRRMTTSPELRWKAHIFFWAKTDMPQK